VGDEARGRRWRKGRRQQCRAVSVVNAMWMCPASLQYAYPDVSMGIGREICQQAQPQVRVK
jgi:hypothetical protein